MPPSKFPQLAVKRDPVTKKAYSAEEWGRRCHQILETYLVDVRISAREAIKHPEEAAAIQRARNNFKAVVKLLLHNSAIPEKEMDKHLKKLMLQTAKETLREGKPTLNEEYAAVEVQIAKQKLPPDKMAFIAEHIRRHKELVALASLASGKLQKASSVIKSATKEVKTPATEAPKAKRSFHEEGVTKPPSADDFGAFLDEELAGVHNGSPEKMPEFAEEPNEQLARPAKTAPQASSQKKSWFDWLPFGKKKGKAKTISEAGGALPPKAPAKSSSEAADQALGGTKRAHLK